MTTFNQNITLLVKKGYTVNQSLNIIKRVNKHLVYCVKENQNYEDSIYFIQQDFTFNIEELVVNCIIDDKVFFNYYDNLLKN
jgi:hypothetical protein